MTFEPKKFSDIFEDMRQRTAVLTDFEVGSVARTLYESFAYEIALLYEKMQLVYLSAYVDTAEGQQLDKVIAILGIKRGLPDFAEGEVTFHRDVGNQEIVIPLGTLVSTIDTPESPKKMYQTRDAALFPQDQTSLAVKVQAVNRGETEVTPAETLVVLPRPIAGIKSVTNAQETRFTGKRRETDEELRQRAKNTLISSGKATLLAIENALLSLPGVKDVKVQEKFRFAKGQVTIARGAVTGEIVIPKGTLLTAYDPLPKPFYTTERQVLGEFASTVTIGVTTAIEGKAGEVTATGGVTWEIQADAPLSNLTATSANPIELGEFGVIEVFVDCDKFDEPAVKQQLQDEIDRVRAAGIFVLLQSAVAISVDGVFRIEVSPTLKLSAQDRSKLEQTVRDRIIRSIDDRSMGEPLLFAQIVKEVLSLDNVNNLEEFRLTTTKAGTNPPIHFTAADKRIETEDFERLKPRYLCVASETKALPIALQFKIADLDSDRQTAIADALTAYFKERRIGESVSQGAIATVINAVEGVTLMPNTLKLIPQPWCQTAPVSGAEVETVVASFVEQPVLGDIFAYSQDLQITGAIKLTLPASLTDQDKLNVRTQIRSRIVNYLNQLKPEADVVFADLIAIAAAVNPVIAVNLDERDFQVLLDGVATVGRVSPQKIEVQQFEKPQLNFFIITSNIEPVRIAAALPAGAAADAKPIELEVTLPPGADANQAKAAVQQSVRTAFNRLLASAVPGQTVNYNSCKNALENLVVGIDYSVTQLSLRATSTADNRIQETDIAGAKDLLIRSVEIASLQPIAAADLDSTIGVTIRTLPASSPA